MKYTRVLFTLALVLVSTACATATATPAATAEPTRVVELRVLPKTIRPGMRAVMVGQGFDRGEPIAFYLVRPDGTKTQEGESTADKNGGAAYELDVNDDWQPGQYVAHVRSRTHPARTAEITFQLGPR